MNILAISHNFPHEDDPSCGVFMARQMLGLRNAGNSITVMVPSVYAPDFISRTERYKLFRPRNLISYEGLKSFHIRFPSFPGHWARRWDGLSCYMFSRIRIRKLHKRNPFDAIYCRCLIPEADVGIRLSRILGVPVLGVAIGHDVNDMANYNNKFYSYFVNITNNVNEIVTTGQGAADKINVVSKNKATVIGGVVDLNTFKPVSDKTVVRHEIGMPEDRFIILFAGHLITPKGIYELVEAFADIHSRKPETLLVICGDGEEGARFRQFVKNLKCANDIKMMGTLNPEIMPKFMQASDLFVLPTYREGMPNVVMEAMGCGLPIVTTAVGGLPAAIGDCDGAILIEPKRTSQIANACVQVIEDPDLRDKMSAASRHKAQDKFGIKRNTERLLQCLNRAISNYKLSQHRIKP